MTTLQDALPAQWRSLCQHINGIAGCSAVELACQRGVPLRQLARRVVLRDTQGFILALYPADSHISLARVRACTNRQVEIAARSEYQSLPQWQGSGPLRDLPRGLATLVDKRLIAGNQVFLDDDDNGLLQVPADVLLRLLQQPLIGDISQTLEVSRASASDNETPPSISQLLEQCLPALSPVPALSELLAADADRLDAGELIRQLSRLPDLAAMLVQVARQPLFGGDKELLTLTDAVQRLGVPVALGWSLGLGIAACFRPTTRGLRGHVGFWRHGLYATSLLWLGRRVWGVDSPTLIMGGLLHNFGYLLLGYLDPARFEDFNRLLAQAPERPVQEMELLVSGDSHCRLGVRLAQLWQLPDAVPVAICEHHNEFYQGPHAELARALLIANRWLQRYGIGDAHRADVPVPLLADAGLGEGDMQAMMNQVLDNCSGLDTLVLQLAHLDLK